MAAPRLPADMIDEAKSDLEWQINSLERAKQRNDPNRVMFHKYDAIARLYFYLGEDSVAQDYFELSLAGAKVFQAEVISNEDSMMSEPSWYVRGLYSIARPLWWIGDDASRNYFEQAIMRLEVGRSKHPNELQRRMCLAKGVCFLIAINRMDQAKQWLDELEQKYGRSSWQKSLEVYRAIVEHSTPNSRSDLEVAFDQLCRLMKLDRVKPYYSNPSHRLVVYEWLRRQLQN